MCTLKATPVVRTQLQDTLRAGVTYADITASPDAIRNEEAGSSETTFSMIKSWSEAIRSHAPHICKK
jgi:hypothetical protein